MWRIIILYGTPLILVILYIPLMLNNLKDINLSKRIYLALNIKKYFRIIVYSYRR